VGAPLLHVICQSQDYEGQCPGQCVQTAKECATALGDQGGLGLRATNVRRSNERGEQKLNLSHQKCSKKYLARRENSFSKGPRCSNHKATAVDALCEKKAPFESCQSARSRIEEGETDQRPRSSKLTKKEDEAGGVRDSRTKIRNSLLMDTALKMSAIPLWGGALIAASRKTLLQQRTREKPHFKRIQ